MKEDYEIDFGKYEGKKISEVPASYLVWCYESLPNRSYAKRRNRELFEYIEKNIEKLRKL